MARPIKNNADYFSHDADMRNDPRIKAVRRKFKLEGYAVWCMLLESITDSDNFRLSNDLDIIAGDYDLEPEKLQDIIAYCLNLGLLQLDVSTNEIYCNQLEKRFEQLLSKRKRDRSVVIASDNTQSKVKESKVDIITHGQGTIFITIAKKYTYDKIQKIFNLETYFTSTGQITSLKESGRTWFMEFINENSGKQFNDSGHLDNAFRNFCKEYTPPARAPSKYENAEYNKTLWTVEAWEKFYERRLESDSEFRKHFGYGELFVSKAMG